MPSKSVPVRSERLTQAEAAAFLRVTVRTLQRWRKIGYGPRWEKGPGQGFEVFYDITALRYFARAIESG